jgi:hypothetical protein
MPERLRLVFGQGLDRESGVLATQPASMEFLKNVYLFQGKAQVRKGARLDSTYTDEFGQPMSHILAVQALRTDRTDVVVGYRQADRRVHVFLRGGIRIGEWFTLDPSATVDPPIVHATDTRGKVFLAHDEPIAALRAPTFIYDPWSPNVLTQLEADFGDGDGVQPVRFRGVTRHLKYLFGWGFGTNKQKQQPHVVRVSLPGEPAQFDKDHYFLIGQALDPIMACVPIPDPSASRLIAFKEQEFYRIEGYDSVTFGEHPGDNRFGLASPRLAVEYAGYVFFWSVDGGPRVTQGGPSEDLALPLDLGGPQPADLVAEGALQYGVATYIPRRRVVLFVFGQRAYALSLRDRPWKWSYMEFGFPVYSAGVSVAPGVANVTPPAGHPAFDSVPAATSHSLTIRWDNVGSVGDEVVEIHMKVATDTVWPVSPKAVVLASADQDQEITVDGLLPDTTYDIALRYRRGGLYHPDYDNDPAFDPGSWPPVSRGQGTTQFAAPNLVSAVWQRTGWQAEAEQITLTWENTEPNAQTQIFRDGVLIHTAAVGETTFADTTITDEFLHQYKLRHDDPTVPATSGDSNVIECWGGPPAPEIVNLQSISPDSYRIVVRLPPIPWSTVSDIQLGQPMPQDQVRVEILDANLTDGMPLSQAALSDPVTYTIDGLPPAGEEEQVLTVSHPGSNGDLIDIVARIQFLVAFGEETDLGKPVNANLVLGS